MRTIILAVAAIAAMSASLVSVEAATLRRPLHAGPPSYRVYGPYGYYRGSDPDPFIRGQLRRDIPLGSQGEGF